MTGIQRIYKSLFSCQSYFVIAPDQALFWGESRTGGRRGAGGGGKGELGLKEGGKEHVLFSLSSPALFPTAPRFQKILIAG